MDLVDVIYVTVREFPRHELFGLSAQMRSAATSVPLNIAEGQGRHSFREFRQFLRRARASLMELETQIEIARRQRYISDHAADALFDNCQRVVSFVTSRSRFGERRTANESIIRMKSPKR